MTSSREEDERVMEILAAARRKPAPEREAYLQSACAGDEDLRREVVEALSWEERMGGFLQQPVAMIADGNPDSAVTGAVQFAAGLEIGQYRIESKLGEGGMSTVWLALDTRLGRQVAIKFLSDDLADAEARRRFQREAQMASSLNHPHIVTVYDIGEFEGRQYLVTEYVDGGTLKDWIKEKRRTPKEVAELLTGVADGLAAAHQAGILHRDVKPMNILVARNGYAKLADFGLAKLAESGKIDLAARSPEGSTRPGLILGTIAYMSPEQASGQPLDSRSDIFSFGVVLYEMLSGKQPFGGRTDLEVLKTIIHGELPPLSEEVPEAYRNVVEKALEKSPAERYQSMREMVVDMRRGQRSGSALPPLPEVPAPTPPDKRRYRPWLWWTAAGVAVGAVLAAILVFWRSSPGQPVVDGVAQLTDDGNPKKPDRPLVSDGSRIYFNEMQGSSEVLAQVSATGGQTGTLTSGIESPMLTDLAPDSSSLLLANSHRQDWFLLHWFLLPLPAGEPRRLPEFDGFFRASFSPSGNFYLSKGRSLYIGQKDASNAHKLFDFQTLVASFVASPDGKRIRVSLWSSFASRSLWEVNADGSGAHPLFPDWQSGADICCGRWTADSRYFVFQSRLQGRADLWALPEGKSWFGRSPSPLRLTNGPLSYEQAFPSRDGKHLYALGLKKRGELVRYDSKSGQFVPYLSGISATDATVSSDGKWIAYQSYPDHNLWRVRADGSERLQLTYPPTTVYLPHISPDGTRVAYWDGYTRSIYVVPVEGGIPRKIEDKAIFACWSPDSNSLVVWIPNSTNQGFGETETIDLRTGKISSVPDSLGTVGPFWPSQDLLVALNIKDTVQGFVTFDFKTKKWSHLVSGPITHWMQSVDGKYLYYTTGGDDPKVLRVRFSDGKVEEIASLKNFRPVEEEGVESWVGVTLTAIRFLPATLAHRKSTI